MQITFTFHLTFTLIRRKRSSSHHGENSMSITIENTLRRVVGNCTGVDPASIEPDTPLTGDSLDHVEVLMEVEDEFGIQIDEVKWEDCKTFADYLALVKATYAEVAA
jgi:acyl carrier protein